MPDNEADGTAQTQAEPGRDTDGSETPTFCTQCGTPAEASDQYCRRCGTPLSDSVAPEHLAATSEGPKPTTTLRGEPSALVVETDAILLTIGAVLTVIEIGRASCRERV